MRLIHRGEGVGDEEAPGTAEPAELHGRGWHGVALSVVTTADGTAEVDGRSGPLGCDTDRAVLRALRSAADWVLVGAATVRAEGYGAPSNPSLRIAVVSRSGVVDQDSTLFTSGAGLLVVPDTAPASTVPEMRIGRADDPSMVDLAGVLARFAGQRVLAEGGPMLTGQLMAEDLVDTLFVTWAPFVGRGGKSLARFVEAAAPDPLRFSMRWLYEQDGSLFARYDRVRPA